MKKIYYYLLGIVLLVPLGLITQNPAWGEWDESFYEQKLGFIPKGIENAKGVDAIFGDYQTTFFGDVGSYYFSALVGMVAIFGIFYLLKRLVVEK